MNVSSVIKHTPTCTSREMGRDFLCTQHLGIHTDSCRTSSEGRKIMCSVKLYFFLELFNRDLLMERTACLAGVDGIRGKKQLRE